MPETTDGRIMNSGEAVRLLRMPRTHGAAASELRCIETHHSWVFIGGDEVLKLKKPVANRYCDHSTVARREFDCREEVRLNSRLASGVYLGLLAVVRTPAGLSLCREEDRPAGAETVDWVVRMRRLPDARRLDVCIAEQRVEPAGIDRLADVLGRFYRRATTARVEPAQHLALLQGEQRINREILLDARWSLETAPAALEAFDGLLAQHTGALLARAAHGHIVDGHGDLRPEHVFLLDPPVVIDGLEFSARLRALDPFDEIAFLALECAMCGAPWIGERLFAGLVRAGCTAPPAALLRLYTAARALLRARLSIAHLLDTAPREPERWPAQARRYLQRALQATARNSPDNAPWRTEADAAVRPRS